MRVRGFAVAEAETTEDPEDFVSDVRGRIECWTEEGDKKAIGMIRGYIVDVERAISVGMPVYDLFDMHSQELSEFWSPLYQSGGNLEPAVVRLLGGRPRNRNVLVLAASEIEPAHRGKKFGLYAAGRIIEHLKMACGIAIGQPFPMQFGPAGQDKGWMRRFGPGLSGEFGPALLKLRKYWGRLGFEQIPGTDFYVVSTGTVHLSGK